MSRIPRRLHAIVRIQLLFTNLRCMEGSKLLSKRLWHGTCRAAVLTQIKTNKPDETKNNWLLKN